MKKALFLLAFVAVAIMPNSANSQAKKDVTIITENVLVITFPEGIEFKIENIEKLNSIVNENDDESSEASIGADEEPLVIKSFLYKLEDKGKIKNVAKKGVIKVLWIDDFMDNPEKVSFEKPIVIRKFTKADYKKLKTEYGESEALKEHKKDTKNGYLITDNPYYEPPKK